MNILLIGSGAREHAMARAIKRAKQPHELFCFASSINPGMVPLCRSYLPGKLNDTEAILHFAENHEVDFAIIGPEAPLALGIVDVLAQQNIAAIGPSQSLAQIETSKGFTRDLLTKYQVPGMPQYKRFTRFVPEVTDFLNHLNGQYVIKADGLMGGKGVKVAGVHLHDQQAAIDYCHSIDGPFVIEEKLVGPEFSLIAFSDGAHLAHMPAVQDHKLAFEGDLGPNTGGMGSYSDVDHKLPFLRDQDIAEAMAINQATIDALKQELGQPYKGILYGGFMRTAEGVKLIEYNARFGDPEAVNILSLLQTDFVDICQAMIAGTLDQVSVQFEQQATVVKYLVPNGYPDDPVKGEAIDLSDVARAHHLYFAAIDQQDSQLIMTGSRAMAVLGIGSSIAEAEQMAEDLASRVKGPVFYRSDIGTQALIDKRIEMTRAFGT